jgi:hypothetical protein
VLLSPIQTCASERYFFYFFLNRRICHNLQSIISIAFNQNQCDFRTNWQPSIDTSRCRSHFFFFGLRFPSLIFASVLSFSDELAFLKSVETQEYASINDIQGSIALQALFWTAEEHKLAVAYFAIPPLLHAANAALFDPNIRKEEYQIATKCVLVLNADSYTAWNLRKKFVAISPQNLRDELKFTSFILTKHPKSIETWVQRSGGKISFASNRSLWS